MPRIDPWTLVTTETDETVLRDRNSVFAVSNGYLTLKGNLCEDRGGDFPTTLVAGVFDAADWLAFIRPTKHERRFHDPEHFDNAGWSPSIANLPDPIHLRTFVGPRELTFRGGTVRGFRQVYDLRRGVYSYEYEHENPDGRITRIAVERFCSFRHPHRAYLRATLTPRNYGDTVRVLSGINGAIRSNLHGERQIAVRDAEPLSDGRCRLGARTVHSEIDVNIAVRTLVNGGAAAQRRPVIEESAVSHVFEVCAETGRPIVVEKTMVVATAEDAAHGVACDILEELGAASAADFDAASVEQAAAWAETWERIDVRIEGDDVAQRNLRFCLLHLMSAAPRHSDRLSIPCKLLTGEFYQGTVFYDTDLYIEPLFTFAFPEIARAMLNYRWHGLEPGRRIAKRLGYKGAKFAWQAGPCGEEELGRWWRYTYLNVHINADVCYSLMLYLHATGDFDFVAEKGIDILVESARFYVSRADEGPGKDVYNITEVAGPDEGHCESRNNFYTNYLASKCMRQARAILERMRAERPDAYEAATKRLDLTESEPREWVRVANGLRILHQPETKLYEQCEGFFSLEDAPEDLLRDRPFWWVIVYPYRAIYQPDVCMALAMDRHRFDSETLAANHAYYKPITMNFSSMSFVINAIIAKEAGDMEFAYGQFMTAATLDLDPTITGRNDTHEGIHGTNAGGAWMAAILGFGGLTVGEDGVAVNPRLPVQWASLTYRFRVCDSEITCRATQNEVELRLSADARREVDLTVHGRPVRLSPGTPVTIPSEP